MTDMASWNFSRKRTSSMQVSSGRPHMLTSNQRGRGKEPVTVLGRMRSAVAVNMNESEGIVLRGRDREVSGDKIGASHGQTEHRGKPGDHVACGAVCSGTW